MRKVFYPTPPPACPECQAVVLYKAGRRVCQDCKMWCHQECAIEHGGAVSSFCLPCVKKHGRVHVGRMARALSESRKRWPALEVYLWSLFFGQDVLGMSSSLDLPVDVIEPMAERLRKGGLWLEDGKVVLDAPEDNALSYEVAATLAALVADGHVDRVGPDSQAVSGGGEQQQ